MRFGAGRIDELADACRSLKIVRPLIITDKFICKLPFTQKAAMILAAADLASSVFDDVQNAMDLAGGTQHLDPHSTTLLKINISFVQKVLKVFLNKKVSI